MIVGASKVGHELAVHLGEEGHDIVFIDKNDSKIDAFTDDFDCNGFVGNGGDPEFLKKAGIETTSLFLALTKNDETNICCCGIAKKLGVKRTVAAVRGPEYSPSAEFLIREMGVDLVINPSKSAAREVAKLIRYSKDMEIESFGKGSAKVATVEIGENSVLAGVDMPQVSAKVGAQILVCAIERNGKMITPKGKHQIHAKDKITFAAIKEEMDKALKVLNIDSKPVKNIVIVGGGKIGYYLAELVMEEGGKVKIIDNDMERCHQLMETFPKAQIISGNGTDSEFMEEQLRGADSCVAVTGSDEENLIISMYAKSVGINRIAAEIDNAKLEKMLKKSGINHVFSTQDVSLSGIIKDTRILASGKDTDSSEEGLRWLHTLNSGKIEAMEFRVGADFALCDVPFKDSRFALKSGVLIAMVIRGEETFVPDGNFSLKAGDHIITVSSEHKIASLSDILA